MPDSPLTDADVLDDTPRQFAKLLQSTARGHVLWTPTRLARGQHMIGDCGYVDGGEFVKLFNVFDEHNAPGIEPLPSFDDDIQIQRVTNVKEVLHSRSIHEIDFSPNVDLSPVIFSPPSSLKLRTVLQKEKEDVAFLTLYGPTRAVAKYLQTRKLENYLAEHASQIVDYYRDSYPVKAHYLMIVYRTTAAASWFGGYTSSKRIEYGAEVSVYGAGGEVKLMDAKSSAWTLTHGEPSWDAENPPEHCVIIRSVRCRWRDRFKHGLRSIGLAITDIFRPSSSAPDHTDTSQYPLGDASIGNSGGAPASDTAPPPTDFQSHRGDAAGDADESATNSAEGDNPLQETVKPLHVASEPT